MKPLYNCLFISIMLLAGSASAQSDAGRQKIESAKIGLITNRLNLTTEQAPQFWAVYNDYSVKKQELNRHLRQINSGTSQGLADSKVLSDLKEVNNTKQKIADLDQDYMDKFLKVISPAQLSELYKSEREFNRMLLNRLNGAQN